MEICEVPCPQQYAGPRFTLRANLLLKELSRLPRLRLLDVGGGRGYLSLRITKMGFKVTILEKDKDAISFSKQLFRSNKTKAKFLMRDFFNYCPEVKYGVVLLSEVLEHVDDVKALEHIKRNLLKYEGYLVISVPGSTEPAELSDSSQGHLRIYSKKFLKNRIRNNGYKIISIFTYGGRLLSIYIRYINQRVAKRGPKQGMGLSISKFRFYVLLVKPFIDYLVYLENLLLPERFRNIGIICIAKNTQSR